MQDLKERTKKFALRIIKFTQILPQNNAGRIFSSQLLRSATSVAANYRASFRARSRLEFVAKLGIVEEEADESLFWLELILESGMLKPELIQPIIQEASEIVAIMVTAKKSAKSKL
jgi:four helix bundle protein